MQGRRRRICIAIALCCGLLLAQARAIADAPRAASEPVAAAPEQSSEASPGTQAALAESETDAFHAIALAKFVTYERGLTTRCDSVMPEWTGVSLLVYGGDPALGDDGGIVTALWVVNVPGTSCGHHRTYRVEVEYAGGRRTVTGMLPGTGISSPDLEPEAVRAVGLGVFNHGHRRCPLDVLNTRLMGGQFVAEKQPWQEIWTVRSCGRMLSVPIRFTPDDDDEGTAIDLDPADIVPAN